MQSAATTPPVDSDADTIDRDDGFVLYREAQPWWTNRLLAILLPFESLTTGGILLAVGYQSPPRDQLILLSLWVVLGLVLPALFLTWRLVTEVTPTHVRARFVGLPSWRIPLDQVEVAEPIKVDPIRDFGGWGIRRSKAFGKVLNVSGNHAVRVTLTNGKIRTLGTRYPEELAGAILAGAMGEPGREILPARPGSIQGHSVVGTSNA
ncbi:MAG: hypothetical protein AB8F26_07205 [Phycisphaerales bacterium]